MIGRELERLAFVEALRVSSLLLRGPRRVGKSTLLDHLAQEGALGLRAVRVDMEGCASLEAGLEKIGLALSAGVAVREGVAWLKRQGVEGVEIPGILRVALQDIPVATWMPRVVQRAVEAEEGLLVLLLDEVPWWLDAIEEQQDAREARGALRLLAGLRAAHPEGLRVVLAGSVGLEPVAKALEVEDAVEDLTTFELPPLREEACLALFEAERPECVLSEGAAVLLLHETAGIPEWVVELARRVPQGLVGVEVRDLEVAIESFIGSRVRPFDRERRRHLRLRHGASAAALMEHLLDLVPAGGQGVPRMGLLAAGLGHTEDRRQVRAAIQTLVDAYYLREDAQGRFVHYSPLFGRAWERWGNS